MLAIVRRKKEEERGNEEEDNDGSWVVKRGTFGFEQELERSGNRERFCQYLCVSL